MKKIALCIALVSLPVQAQMLVTVIAPHSSPAHLTKDQCPLGVTLTFTQEGGEIRDLGPTSHIWVRGMVDRPEYNGIYRVQQIVKWPNAQGITIRTEITARCIKTPGNL